MDISRQIEKIADPSKTPHRAIWAIAGPAIIANSSTPLVGLVDTWAIGHLPGAAYLAAIAVGSTIFTFIYWGFGFLRMGTTGHVAQAYGRGDSDALAATVFRASMLALMIALALLALQALILRTALVALAPPDDIQPLIHQYFSIRIWSAPASLLLFTLNGYLIGVARAKAALMLQLFLNILNAAFNLIFVIGFNLDVEGVALGTVLAEYLALAFGFFLMHRHLRLYDIFQNIAKRAEWRWDSFRALVSTNLFLFVRTLFLLTTFSLVTRDAGQLGPAALAASQVILTFSMIISLGLDGFAYAAEALTGAAYGAKDQRRFILFVRRSFYWAVAVAFLYSGFFWLQGHTVINLLTDIENVRLLSKNALPAVILLPVTAVWCYQFDGVFIGATASRAMLLSMMIAFFVFLAVKDALTNEFSLLGLWLAMNIFMVARGLTLALYYPRLKRGLT